MITSKSAPVVLICDDDPILHLAVKQALQGFKEKFECRSAYNGDEALVVIRNHRVDALLLDVNMRREGEGLEYLPKFRDADPDLAIVMISGNTDFGTVREAMRLGAMDYVSKDFDTDELLHVLNLALQKKRLLLRGEQQNFEAVHLQKSHVMVGSSPKMGELRKIIEKVKKSPANVVITGETGTGKEVVARQLRGTLPDGTLAPFVAVDSSTIQSTMAESILFGHEKGAFTGAERTSKGVFEEADQGTVYFDEIANMPLEIQAKLLRVIQEKEVVRLGSSKPIQLEFRVICATNQKLEELVAQKKFKEDLLQRLNVLPVSIPALRERRADIPELIRHFAAKNGSNELKFSDEAMDALLNYSWPGNVRELSNLVAYLQAMVDAEQVELSDLPAKITEGFVPGLRSQILPKSGESSFYEQVLEFERGILEKAWAQQKGIVTRVAEALGMDRSHLYNKLKEHGLHNPAKDRKD
ncbi:sigma-54 dependent transcriptional regulator [bacterium]|jgi:DNA-binding NtrC family response regulator|nr:sigma-54 dependent transcriptional regulator [bacterium]